MPPFGHAPARPGGTRSGARVRSFQQELEGFEAREERVRGNSTLSQAVHPQAEGGRWDCGTCEGITNVPTFNSFRLRSSKMVPVVQVAAFAESRARMRGITYHALILMYVYQCGVYGHHGHSVVLKSLRECYKGRCYCI